MMFCKLKKHKEKQSFWPFRLSGGADNEDDDQISIEQLGNREQSVSPMVKKAIKNAEIHGINLHHGVRNLANGNCAFESVLDSINTRTCFEDSFDGTPSYWRKVWMTQLEKIAYADWNAGLSKQEWKEGFDKLKQAGTYELGLGDLVPPGIAHCTRKNLLIFNTSPLAHSPIYVISASSFGGHSDTEIPVCLAYDQSHYESLVPASEDDIRKTVVLTKQYLDGKYSLKMNDILVYYKEDNESKQNYDDNFPVLGSKGKKLRVQASRVAPAIVKDLSNMNKNDDETENRNVNNKESIFKDLLPIHLKNKKPKDMTIIEKKEYTNLRRKFSRANETDEAAKITKEKDAKAHAERISN